MINAKKSMWISLIYMAVLLLLSACSQIIVKSVGEPSQATETWSNSVDSSQTSQPTETPFSAFLPLTSAGDESSPTVDGPVVVTQVPSRVRTGPGMNFADYYFLAEGVTLPILGRNEEATWWAVPGPGDGSGPHGWISAAVVSVQGDVGDVPVISDLDPPSESFVMGNLGQPPTENNCVVSHPGTSEPVNLYSSPQAGGGWVVAALGVGRWADIVGVQSGWFQVQDASGLTGWVHETEVAFVGLCSAPGSGPALPLVENPGLPPADVCLASRLGQFPAPGIHRGPGRQFALMARLENWAEVIRSEIGWHQILVSPNQVGWVSGGDVDLTGPCSAADPGPQRIQFVPGAVSQTVSGTLQPPRRNLYLFRALAGQQVNIEISSSTGLASFMLNGMSDGQPYKRLEDERRNWSAELPLTQDYLLTVAAPAGSPSTDYSLALTILPLEEADAPEVGNLGPPPLNVCVVEHPGPGGAEVVNVHNGPGQSFAVVGRLARNQWVEVVGLQNGWYEIRIASGESGWVEAAIVARNPLCPDPGIEAPLIFNRGAPANDRCVVFLSNTEIQPVAVHLRPGDPFGVVARLGNWAEVLGDESGWYLIQIPQGGAGWVDGARVELSAGC